MAESDAQKGAEVRRELTQAHRKSLYQAARFLNLDTRCRIGQRVPCEIYVQDREEGAVDKKIGKQVVDLRWEPLLADGPTNARFAVVDYDGDTGILQPPAHWNEEAFAFQVADGREITEETTPHQFRQVNAWATAQRVLEYYEDPRQLGRPIPWGFEGNRLMIVPQAGFQNNAYYDRNSKSLQLYYFGDPEKPRYACLSHDIVAHETGHAVLDGIRPYFLENCSWETAAFHEFVGDLTAILLAFRNNDVRSYLEEKFGTHLELADFLAGVAGEFGKYVENRKFLRSALNSVSFADAQQERSAHFGSQVLSGAMFEILVGVACQYLSPERQAERKKPATPAGALWWAANRMGGLALQPLDLLPPVDVRLLDYAWAVLRNEEINDPEDRHGYRNLIREVFHKRGLCSPTCDGKNCLLSPAEPPRLPIFHDITEAARSRTAAYHLIHDNRDKLQIPKERDFVVVDLYDCDQLNSASERLPRRVVIEYVWREDVKLDGEQFGRWQGETVNLLCGGTLVFDGRSNLRWWTAKPGGDSPEGKARRVELLEHLARIVAERRLTLAEETEGGALAGQPAVAARRVDGILRLETGLHLCGGAEEGEQWTTSF